VVVDLVAMELDVEVEVEVEVEVRDDAGDGSTLGAVREVLSSAVLLLRPVCWLLLWILLLLLFVW